MRVRFRVEAVADVEAAGAWYDEQRSGLGDEFVGSLERAIDLVVTFPDAFPEIAAGHRRGSSPRAPASVPLRSVLPRRAGRDRRPGLFPWFAVARGQAVPWLDRRSRRSGTDAGGRSAQPAVSVDAFAYRGAASYNTAVSASAHYASLRSLRGARRPAELPSPLYAAWLAGLRVNDGAVPATSERYGTRAHPSGPFVDIELALECHFAETAL